MENDIDKLFSIGEFAKKAGVTVRTLRYYDKIGLLTPTVINGLGYRFYSKKNFAKLQKILTLKFIGLSLQEIDDIMQYDINDEDLKKSLYVQKEIIQEKIKHMSSVVEAIDEAIHMVNSGNALNWTKFINIINAIDIDKSWGKQYKNASNLRARINLHEKFSSNKKGWMQWYFQHLSFPKEAKVLELGCGDGSLWQKNLGKIPKNLNVILTDFSEGMLSDARSNLRNAKENFKFKVVNAEKIPYKDNEFDMVIANHMLYHVSNIDKALKEINRVLKGDGKFYTSTVGKNHMKEMREIVSNIDKNILKHESFYLTKKFQLENGEETLEKYFINVKLKRYKDSLNITEGSALIKYIFSMTENVRKEFNEEKIDKLYNYINKIIKEEGKIYITKDTGFYVCEKKYSK